MPESTMKLIKYDFPENAITEEKDESPNSKPDLKINNDFENVGIFNPIRTQSPKRIKKIKKKPKKKSELDNFLHDSEATNKNPKVHFS